MLINETLKMVSYYFEGLRDINCYLLERKAINLVCFEKLSKQVSLGDFVGIRKLTHNLRAV